MKIGKIILTYKNYHNPVTEIGIWGYDNISNKLLSYNRKTYPDLDIKRRKVDDIIENDRPEEVWLKNELIRLMSNN